MSPGLAFPDRRIGSASAGEHTQTHRNRSQGTSLRCPGPNAHRQRDRGQHIGLQVLVADLIPLSPGWAMAMDACRLLVTASLAPHHAQGLPPRSH